MNQPQTVDPTLARDYPPPPWTLAGTFLAATAAVRASTVADLVPAPLSLVTLPGGLALSVIIVGRYGPGSTLEYSELTAGLLVRYGARPGMYVTHIAVDSPPSLRGGHEIWHLPKQLWRFEWELGAVEANVRVWDGMNLVCTLNGVPLKAGLWPLRAPVSTLSVRDGVVSLTAADFKMRINYAPWSLHLGPDGPLTVFKPVGPLITSVIRGEAVIQARRELIPDPTRE